LSKHCLFFLTGAAYEVTVAAKSSAPTLIRRRDHQTL